MVIRLVLAGLALALTGCGEATVPVVATVPSDWKTLESKANHFTLRYPPDWGERDGGSGAWRESGCSDTSKSYRIIGAPLYCNFTPKNARWSRPDFGFDFYIMVSRQERGSDFDKSQTDYFSRLSTDVRTGSVEMRRESFAGRDWYVIDLVERMPPVIDYGHCLTPDGDFGQSVKREYTTLLKGRLVMAMYFYGCTPEEFDEFASIADQVVHTVQFK